MKVLMIDKYWFVKGGAERYMFELSKVLEANGHEIIPFAMDHADNFETPYSKYFAPNIEYNVSSAVDKAKTFVGAFGKMIYSLDAKRNLERLLAEHRPDVAHLHMIDHQLSPSILHALKKFKVPVIQTVHQYKLVCPNYRFYNPVSGEICEKCLGGNMLHPVLEKCHKNSAVAGLMIAIEGSIHRRTRIYEKNIDIFHVPSHFMGKKFHEGGVGNGKVRHLFYTIKISDFKPDFRPGDYLLYFGRLADEKGIFTFLKAVQPLKETPVYIVGDGPLRADLEQFAQQHELKQVRFFGLKSGQELEDVVRNARAIVVPSEWYDNSPLVIYESFAYGKPVIASKMGGMPELVEHRKNGLLFDAGDVAALTEQCRELWENPATAEQYGRAARAKAEQQFEPQVHYEQIYGWYQEMLDGRNGTH